MKKAFIFTVMIIAALAAFSGCGENNKQTNIETTVAEETTLAEETTIDSTQKDEGTTADTSTAPTEAVTSADDKKKETNPTSGSNAPSGNNAAANNTSAPKNVAVSNISISKGNMTISVGSSSSFEVYIYPESASDKQYNVVTSNGNATVSCNGSIVTVYGQNIGNCSITVSSTNGISTVCNVTVQDVNKSNNNSGKSSGSKTNNNNLGNNSKATITDDTLLTHKQLCSEEILDRLINKVNEMFQQKGMTYNASLNKNNSGWLLSGTNYYPGDYYYSTNSFLKKELEGYEEEVDAIVNYDGDKYTDFQFRCYYEKQSNGEYYFYFCYA